MAEMSLDNIRITADSCNVDFNQARRLAEEVILGMVRSPRLIAWIDSKKGKRQALSDDGLTQDPTHNHDSGVRVDINNNDYSFIFTETK